MSWDLLKNIIKQNKYNHYSFDFWSTIAYSNPKFKEKRLEYILSLSPDSLSYDMVDKVFSKIGSEYNKSMENDGNINPPLELYGNVLKELGIIDIELKNVVSVIDNIFLDYPPLYSKKFIETYSLISKSSVTTSITSNTAFISGLTIEKTLQQNLSINTFDFQLFSDLVGIAKPNNEIFDLLRSKAMLINENLAELNIIHVGDNLKNDYYGAKNSGIDALLVIDTY